MFLLLHLPAPGHYTPTFRSWKLFYQFSQRWSLWSLRFDGVRGVMDNTSARFLVYVTGCTYNLFLTLHAQISDTGN